MDSIERHSAGATVQHSGPFSRIAVPVLEGLPTAEIRDQWIKPLYFGLDKPHIASFIRSNLSQVTDELILKLLSHFDWRSKTAGAYLAALCERSNFADLIGRLLLRSDV